MRHHLMIAMLAASFGAGVASVPALANESLAKGAELSTTQPRHSVPNGADQLAYDVDFSATPIAHAMSRG